jgi:hypothetical protein
VVWFDFDEMQTILQVPDAIHPFSMSILIAKDFEVALIIDQPLNGRLLQILFIVSELAITVGA